MKCKISEILRYNNKIRYNNKKYEGNHFSIL